MSLQNPEVPLASTIARYVLEAVGRFADEIEDKASFLAVPAGISCSVLQTIEDMTVRSVFRMGHPRTFIPSGRLGSPCSPPSWTVRGGAAPEKSKPRSRKWPCGMGSWSSRLLARVRRNCFDGDHGGNEVEGFLAHVVRVRPCRRIRSPRRPHRA